MSKPFHVLMLVESSRESGREFIAGVSEYAAKAGPWIFSWEQRDLSASKTGVSLAPHDGLIARDHHSGHRKIPSVLLGYRRCKVPDSIFVDVDDRGIAEAAARHFFARHFRHFAFCGWSGCPGSASRAKAFLSITARHAQPAARYKRSFDLNMQGRKVEDMRRAVEWLQGLPKPVAILAANDELGAIVLGLCLEAGLAVPEACAVLGVDDDPVVTGLSYPPLASIRVMFREAGYRAAQHLDRMMRGEASKAQVVTAEVERVHVRRSADVFALDDKLIAKALHYIHENRNQHLSVPEVARTCGISRRLLEVRFRAQLKSSVQGYHRQRRAEYVIELLETTGLRIHEIADRAGFSEPGHLTRFFRKMTGVAPSLWRKTRHERDQRPPLA